MSDHAPRGRDERDSDDAHPLPEEVEGPESIEAYETDDGVVFYDAQNPLAWLKATHAVRLGELV
ncbi:hypothetical protein ACFQH6_06570 [Halobacteriaceae archaeon GCM10025711]